VTEQINKLREIIATHNNIVFFGGAGVSTESGIKDFRSVDGLYNEKYKYPPEEILSYSFFVNNPEEYYRFHREKLVVKGVKPNAAHYTLARLEGEGKLNAVITQNIDGLHQAAGSKNVLELHGTANRCYCMKCRKEAPIQVINEGTDVPRCECGGLIRPDIGLYEEQLDENVLRESIEYIKAAEVLIIGGTSLAVYPAAGLIRYFSGDHLVLINRDETPADRYADLVIHGKIGEVLAQI